MSDIELLPRPSDVRFVKPDTAEMSDIELLLRYRSVRLVKLANGEISDIELPKRSRWVRLIANSSPVKSLMPLPDAPRLVSVSVKVAISAGVIGVPGPLLSIFSRKARRLESGMLTVVLSATALKVTVLPTADTSTVFVPRLGPSVSVLSALPLKSVMTRSALSVPPPTVTVNVTQTP